MKPSLSLETLDHAIESIRKVEVYAELISAAACSEIACSGAISEGARAICEETGRLREILRVSRNGATTQRLEKRHRDVSANSAEVSGAPSGINLEKL